MIEPARHVQAPTQAANIASFMIQGPLFNKQQLSCRVFGIPEFVKA